MAGVRPPPGIHGVDLSGFFGGREPPERPFAYGGYSNNHFLRDERWAYMSDNRLETPQLYDLESDPGEVENVAATYPDVVEELSEPCAAGPAASSPTTSREGLRRPQRRAVAAAPRRRRQRGVPRGEATGTSTCRARARDSLAGGLFAVFPCSPFRGADHPFEVDYAKPPDQREAVADTLAMVERLGAIEREASGRGACGARRRRARRLPGRRHARRGAPLRGCRGDRHGPRGARELPRLRPPLARPDLEPPQRVRPRNAVRVPRLARPGARPERRRPRPGARLQRAAAWWWTWPT